MNTPWAPGGRRGRPRHTHHAHRTGTCASWSLLEPTPAGHGRRPRRAPPAGRRAVHPAVRACALGPTDLSWEPLALHCGFLGLGLPTFTPAAATAEFSCRSALATSFGSLRSALLCRGNWSFERGFQGGVLVAAAASTRIFCHFPCLALVYMDNHYRRTHSSDEWHRVYRAPAPAQSHRGCPPPRCRTPRSSTTRLSSSATWGSFT